MRILVCGGRDFGDIPSVLHPTYHEKVDEYKFIQQKLSEIAKVYSSHYNPDDNWLPFDLVIIEGGAKGVDRAAGDWATNNYALLKVYPADWNTYGKAAGYIRNQRMLDEGEPDLVVAFPGGKGTDMMIKLALRAGVEVLKIEYLPT